MPPKKKTANGYKFAEPLPKGTVVTDIGKKRWKLGPSIGKGGFGEIYSAQEEGAKGEKYPYVVKIEPHSNGPLFVEINFYIRHAKPVDIDDFKREKGLKTFGMPVYYGSGSHEYNGEKYRFLVMDRFSTDLQKLYIDNKKMFPVDTVFKIGIQLLDVLEYIHQRGYVHADIKAANVLLGATKETLNKQVYLVDFGLATKYSMEKEFKPNPKKAHDGTIEFLSRDAHQGVQTRRGDLEILAYNLIQWLGCTLPWEKNLSDPKVVQKSKEENMATVQKMLKACFGAKPHPQAIAEFLSYLQTLKFNTEPDYKKIRTIFTSGIKAGGGSIGTILRFSEGRTPSKRARTPVTTSDNKRVKGNSGADLEVNGDETPKKKRGRQKNAVPLEANEDEKMEVAEDDGFDAAPDNITRRKKPLAKKAAASKSNLNKRVSKSMDSLASVDDPFNGFTPAMKDIMLKKLEKGAAKKPKTNLKKASSELNLADDNLEGYTDEMKEVALKRKAKGVTKKTKTNLKKASSELSLEEDSLKGYTNEMKELALKRKAKGKNTKANKVPVPTTSKTSSKRGLAQPKPDKNGKLWHGDVAGFSDESDFE